MKQSRRPSTINVGKVVALLREREGLSQEQLAQRGGFERTYISKVENGGCVPCIDTLIRIGNAIGVEAWRVLRYAQNGGKRPKP